MDRLDNLKKSFQAMKWYEWVIGTIMVLIAGWAMISAFLYPSPDGNPPWLTVLNFISAVCGIVCVFFCAKASVSNFAFGLVNTIVYAIYLFYWRIWGTFALEMVVYLPFNILSWIIWSRHRDEDRKELTKAKKLSPGQDCIVGAVDNENQVLRAYVVIADTDEEKEKAESNMFFGSLRMLWQ